MATSAFSHEAFFVTRSGGNLGTSELWLEVLDEFDAERGIELLRTFCRRGMESREFGGWKELLGWEMVTGRVRVADRCEDMSHCVGLLSPFL